MRALAAVAWFLLPSCAGSSADAGYESGGSSAATSATSGVPLWGHGEAACTWPECAAECPPCLQAVNRSGVLDCIIDFPLVAECAPQFTCHLGKCVCRPGLCLHGDICVPRSCTEGARPPPFEPGGWVRRLARFGPPAPSSHSSLVLWQLYALAALVVPILLALLGIATAAAVVMVIHRGPDMRACRKVPHFPVFLVAWALWSAWATASGASRQERAMHNTAGEAAAQLGELKADFERVLDKASILKNTSETFSTLVNQVPQSCIQGVAQSAMTKVVKAVNNATQTIFEDVHKLNDICEVLPDRIGAFLLRVYIACFFIVYAPMLPLVLQILGILGIMITVLLSNYNPRPEIAERALVLLRKYGSWGFAALIVVAVGQSALYLHVGIVAGNFCTDVDANMMGIVSHFHFARGEGIGHEEQITSNVIGAARFYILGDGYNPIDAIVADIQGNVRTLGEVHDITLWIEKAAKFVCPAMQNVNTEMTLETANDIVDFMKELLRAKNIWPYYDKVVHRTICSDLPKHLTELTFFNALIGFVLLPILAVVADVDLKRMVLYKLKGGPLSDSAEEEEEEELDVMGEEPDPKLVALAALALPQSSQTYTHVTRTTTPAGDRGRWAVADGSLRRGRERTFVA